MLHHIKLTISLYGEAAATANYIRNRCPISGQDKTPYEMFTGIVPDLTHLRVFGSKSWALIPEALRQGKLQLQSTTRTMIGYSKDSKAYRLLDTNTGNIQETMHANFQEGNDEPDFEE